jgi:hypothetical protein
MSFSCLVVNFTTRQAAEQAFCEVDRIRTGWPPYTYPHPREPVRWAKLQGVEELQSAFGNRAYYLSGLPGNFEIPAGAHTFFELPPHPSNPAQIREPEGKGFGEEGNGARTLIEGQGSDRVGGAESPGLQPVLGIRGGHDNDQGSILPAVLDRGQLKRPLDDGKVGSPFPACTRLSDFLLFRPPPPPPGAI